jgi:dGTPase
MGFDEDLSEAIALAHDLGHTPFGHAGEGALLECMRAYDGFDHNAHSLRLVTEIERHYAEFDGLNLTWETLEGIVKHNGPLTTAGSEVPFAIRNYCDQHDLEIATFASVEAQMAALSDDIAYNNHDIDDGLRAGLFSIEDLRSVGFVNEVFENVLLLYPTIERSRLIPEVVRRLIALMIDDAMETTSGAIKQSGAQSVEDIRGLGHPVGTFSDDVKSKDLLLKEFLWTHMYRHPSVVEMTDHAKNVVRDLFELFMQSPKELPGEWAEHGVKSDEHERARLVSDYIAGMTDRFAINLHQNHFAK